MEEQVCSGEHGEMAISKQVVLSGEKHRTCARIATSFVLRADLPRTVLHCLPPRPAPCASLPLQHIARHRRRCRSFRQSPRGGAATTTDD